MHTIYISKIKSSPLLVSATTHFWGHDTAKGAIAEATIYPEHVRPTMEVLAIEVSEITQHCKRQKLTEAHGKHFVSVRPIQTIPGKNN